MSASIKLFPEIKNYVGDLAFDTLTSERKEALQPLVNYIISKVSGNSEVRINFICTHNSRRSHLAQIWAQAAAYHYTVPNVVCYSGGTEATALYPAVAQSLENAGFAIQVLSHGDNPVYAVKHSESEHPVIAFSKAYYDAFNPKEDFAAIMTCSQADGGCPFISGAEARIAITYEDPKVFDDTPEQADRYNERSREIAIEMFYVFSKIKK